MMLKNKRVIVAPLNWGLGHATRCIPIINELLKNNVEVVIVANNQTEEFLKTEFPKLEFYKLSGINFSYGRNISKAIIFQFHKLIKSFLIERDFIINVIPQLNIQGIISDSRFGLYSNSIPSIYLTHQLHIEVPTSLKFISPLLNYFHRIIINQFTKCLVLDSKSENNLSGKLGHPANIPKNVNYIGPITRFKHKSKNNNKNILAILSGPEPHRTEFELSLIHQSIENNIPITIVRGIKGNEECYNLNDNIKLYNNSNTVVLKKLLDDSGILISRLGYSTLMDLNVTKKKAILVPTPGQSEQEYLAVYHKSVNNYLIVNKNEFDLKNIFSKTNIFSNYKFPKLPVSKLRQTLKDFINQLI